MPTEREIEAAIRAYFRNPYKSARDKFRAALEAAERERDKIKAEQKYALEAHLSRDDLNCP